MRLLICCCSWTQNCKSSHHVSNKRRTTMMMAGIMLTCCIHYKSSKTTYNLYTRVIDCGPHTNSILRGGGRLIRGVTYMWVYTVITFHHSSLTAKYSWSPSRYTNAESVQSKLGCRREWRVTYPAYKVDAVRLVRRGRSLGAIVLQ